MEVVDSQSQNFKFLSQRCPEDGLVQSFYLKDEAIGEQRGKGLACGHTARGGRPVRCSELPLLPGDTRSQPHLSVLVLCSQSHECLS